MNLAWPLACQVTPRGSNIMQPDAIVTNATKMGRRTLLSGLTAAAAATATTRQSEAAPSQVLRIAMTASDLPTVTGIPNNGGEGFRFLGYPAYDGVVNWDYSHVNQTADATPGLFASWMIDPGNPTRWVF